MVVHACVTLQDYKIGSIPHGVELVGLWPVLGTSCEEHVRHRTNFKLDTVHCSGGVTLEPVIEHLGTVGEFLAHPSLGTLSPK